MTSSVAFGGAYCGAAAFHSSVAGSVLACNAANSSFATGCARNSALRCGSPSLDEEVLRKSSRRRIVTRNIKEHGLRTSRSAPSAVSKATHTSADAKRQDTTSRSVSHEPQHREDVADGPMPQGTLNCVVKLYCTHSVPNFAMPWSMERQKMSTSTGFIVKGNRILTCAHCVEHHTMVMIKPRGLDVKFPATVVAVGAECDLALLRVDDPEFWSNGVSGNDDDGEAPFLIPGSLPYLQDRCAVVGYPTGGENLSITEGVCSRIEMQGYVHANAELLAVQLDAAINDGNSGGPVLNEYHECVGVAFQSLDPGETDSIGYFVPYSVVQHFLDDVDKNGSYTGFPSAGFLWQKMENRSLRAAMGVPDLEHGILVRSVAETSDVAGKLQSGDIVTSIDGVPVSHSGTVPFVEQPGERIAFTYLVTRRFVGETMTLGVIRNGQQTQIEYALPALGSNRLVPLYHDSQPQGTSQQMPEYVVYGGLVFLVLTCPYLKSEYGSEWIYEGPVRQMDAFFYGDVKKDGRSEVVVLAQVLNSSVTAGYEDTKATILLRFNDTEVMSLAHLATLLDAFEQDAEQSWAKFELDRNELIILDREEARKHEAEILSTHRILKARELRAVVNDAES